MKKNQDVHFRFMTVGGINVFYREAGSKEKQTLLLLHGFPSSSHMFRNLIPQLAEHYHIIAPDYPGFGYSSQPLSTEFPYTFVALADLMNTFVESLEIKEYVLYVQDYGGPVGFRLALKHPERVKGIIVQNATIAIEGWHADITKQLTPFWNHRTPETEAPIRLFVKAETTKWQYTQGEPDVSVLCPDAWMHDQIALEREANDAIQLNYIWSYRDNVRHYPDWQKYVKDNQPPLLIVWGQNDPFFTLEGVNILKALAPEAETHFYDAGHFALESHCDEIAATIKAFLSSNLK